MKQVGRTGKRRLASDWLLACLVALLPMMKPPVAYPLIAADLVFPLAAIALAFEIATRQRRLWRDPAFAVMLIYLASQGPSLLATTDLSQSAFRLIIELYLIGLAALTILAVTSEDRLRLITLVWLAVSMLLGIVSAASLAVFAANPAAAVYRYAAYHFGTLPPGHYPRLALTFLNANMACNYLTGSLGLLLVAWYQRWLTGRAAGWALAAIVIAALPTLSPGLGGIALLLGLGAWLTRRWRIGLVVSAAVAAAFVFALAFTPIPHATAPFLIQIPGTSLVLAPSARFLTWTSAWLEFTRHPLVGHGIGIAPAAAKYAAPSGELQFLTDAHNIVLSIAAQTGILGLCGLAAVVGYAFWLAFKGNMASRFLAITFLDGFLYQGLGGSFENARHLWIILGLAAAANRLPLSPADGNSRKAAEPSPG